ncbi:hypothetical protein [Streptomyces sp. NPDC051286]|uniref:hypothetical protein n=1 Tax=Streptomyces sp. NPDC051286 TaxID=3365647 RepID=UPI003799EF71
MTPPSYRRDFDHLPYPARMRATAESVRSLDAVTEALRAAGLTHSASEAALLADARGLP